MTNASDESGEGRASLFPRPLAILDGIAATIATFSGVVAGVVLFAMMWLITGDVVARYVFGRPTQVAHELSGYALVAIGFLGAASTQRAGRHIEITALTGSLPRRIRRWLRAVTLTIAIGYFAWLAWATMLPVTQHLQFGAVSVTPLRAPLWIPTAMIPLGLALLLVQLLVDVARELISGDDGDGEGNE